MVKFLLKSNLVPILRNFLEVKFHLKSNLVPQVRNFSPTLEIAQDVACRTRIAARVQTFLYPGPGQDLYSTGRASRARRVNYHFEKLIFGPNCNQLMPSYGKFWQDEYVDRWTILGLVSYLYFYQRAYIIEVREFSWWSLGHCLFLSTWPSAR